MFHLYKPLRNYMRQFALVPSLTILWQLAEHIVHGLEFPVADPARDALGRPIQIKGTIHLWELDTLARELVLNAGSTGTRSIGNWRDLSDAVNRIRDLDDCLSGRELSPTSVLRHLHRVVHQQFPWQSRPNITSMVRYHKIFGAPVLEALVQAKVGLSVTQFYQMAFATAGNFLTKPGMRTDNDYGVLNISREASTAVFDRLSYDVASLRAATVAVQTYDSSWPFTFNPLRDRPLLRFDAAHPERVICPLPTFLMHRVSDGLYYDICKEPGFDNAFGNSFQAYVGEVLKLFFNAPSHQVVSEAKYEVGKNLKHGIDWIVTDTTANMFIECKTKRLRLVAKFSSGSDELETDLGTMAGFLVQSYKNILDAKAGVTPWRPNELPIYPVILTLEDWWLFSPPIVDQLDTMVRARLADVGVPPTVVDDMPYTVASVAEVELAVQIMVQTGIAPYLAQKTNQEHRGWVISGFSRVRYHEEMRKVSTKLFDEEWLKLAVPTGGELGCT